MMRVLFVAALWLLVVPAFAEPLPRLAIIIDDLGYQQEAGRRAIALPGPVSFAVLPQTPQGAALARTAHAEGKDVLLHLPLQAVADDAPNQPTTITLDMSRRVFGKTFAEAIESVPFAIGVSSHQGSLLTQHPGHMSWLMEELVARDALIFIDSFTTQKSVALRMAREAGIPATRRDVFLDHEPTDAAIAREFERLKRLARQRGTAVGIGHPYPETLEFLERALPALAADGFELVPISALLGRGQAVAIGRHAVARIAASR